MIKDAPSRNKINTIIKIWQEIKKGKLNCKCGYNKFNLFLLGFNISCQKCKSIYDIEYIDIRRLK